MCVCGCVLKLSLFIVCECSKTYILCCVWVLFSSLYSFFVLLLRSGLTRPLPHVTESSNRPENQRGRFVSFLSVGKTRFKGYYLSSVFLSLSNRNRFFYLHVLVGHTLGFLDPECLFFEELESAVFLWVFPDQINRISDSALVPCHDLPTT